MPVYTSPQDATPLITSIYAGAPSTPRGSNPDFFTGADADIFRALLKFDLSSIPTGATCNSATLYLICGNASNWSADRAHSVYHMRRAWTESGATWNTYDGTNAWGTAGAGSSSTDYYATAIATFLTPTSANIVAISLDTATVASWFGSGTNNGMMIRNDNEADWTWKQFLSDDTSTAAYRPYIVVDYTEGGGAVDLEIEDLTVSPAIDSLTLTQAHTLTIADLQSAPSVDSLILTQAHALTIADVTVQPGVDAPVLTQVHALSIADLTIAPTVDAPVLTQTHTLAIADITVTPEIESLTLTQVHALVIADLTVQTQIDTIVFSAPGAVDLVISDLTITAQIDAPALNQAHALVIEDVTITPLVDAPAITQSHDLTIEDITLQPALDALTLTQAHDLVIEDLAIQAMIDSLVLFVVSTRIGRAESEIFTAAAHGEVHSTGAAAGVASSSAIGSILP